MVLTLGTRPRHGKRIPSALGDCGFDVPFDGPSLGYGRTATSQMSIGPIDEWFVNSSNCILLLE